MRLARVHRVALLVIVVSISSWASSDAQTVRTKPFQRVPAPRSSVHLDLGTGAYVRGPVVKDRGGSTIADFQNLDAFDHSGFGWLGLETGGGSCRWFSSAAKGTAAHQSHNASDLMTDVVFFYCTDALDPASGGVGGSVTLGFYEGYTVFGGAPTTTAALVSLTGMPGHVPSFICSFCTTTTCYGMSVSFPTMVAFADSQFIGYSWQFEDLGTDGIHASTIPFLACVVSCSGLNIAVAGTSGGVGGSPLGLGEDGQGMVDLIDLYCTAPPVQTTFSYGTVLPPWRPATRTSINMRIQEAADLVTTNVSYNATLTPNSDLLSATNATLGSTWTATLSRIPATSAGMVTLVLRRGRIPLPNGTAGAGPPFGRALIAGSFLTTITTPHDGSTGVLAQSIPLQLAYCGLHFAAQARSSGGGLANFRLSSAVEGTIGTF